MNIPINQDNPEQHLESNTATSSLVYIAKNYLQFRFLLINLKEIKEKEIPNLDVEDVNTQLRFFDHVPLISSDDFEELMNGDDATIERIVKIDQLYEAFLENQKKDNPSSPSLDEVKKNSRGINKR